MSAAVPPISALPPIPPNIADLAGPQLIGSLLNFYLFGVLSVQVYVYRVCFPRDKASIKALVYTIFGLLLLSTCMNAADAYFWFARGFGDMIKFSKTQFSPFYTPILGSVIALMIQLFFCYRIWIIKSAALPLSIVIAIISVLQATGGIGGGLKAYIAANSIHDTARTILVYMWLVGAAVADVIIAVAMSVLLMQANRRSNGQSNDLVKRIVVLILETNTLSASVAIVGVVLFAGIPNTTFFIPATMVLPGIYANTLLVTFNNRAFANGAPGGSRSQGAQSFADTQHAYPRPPVAPMTFAPNPNRVLVTTHQVSDADGISLNRLERGKQLEDNKTSGWNDAPYA